MIVYKTCGERDAPREVDGRCAVGHGGRRGVVILLPVEITRTKPDDVLVCGISLHDGVLRMNGGVERRCEQSPCNHRCADEERYAEQGEYVLPQKCEKLTHSQHPLGARSEYDILSVFYVYYIISIGYRTIGK